MRLEGRVAIVTGGGRGIGEAIACLFAREGASVVVADVDEAPAAAVAGKIAAASGNAMAFGVDVAEAGQVEALVAAAVERYGHLDVMVNNAGVAAGGRLAEISEDV